MKASGKRIHDKGEDNVLYDSPCYGKAIDWYDSGYGRVMQKLRHTVIEGIFGQAKTYHGMSKARFSKKFTDIIQSVKDILLNLIREGAIQFP